MTKPPARCGTPSGERRHRRDQTPVCAACRDARLAYDREYKARPQYAPDLAYEGAWVVVRGIQRPTKAERKAS